MGVVDRRAEPRRSQSSYDARREELVTAVTQDWKPLQEAAPDVAVA
jgi:hypothetical protein